MVSSDIVIGNLFRHKDQYFQFDVSIRVLSETLVSQGKCHPTITVQTKLYNVHLITNTYTCTVYFCVNNIRNDLKIGTV